MLLISIRDFTFIECVCPYAKIFSNTMQQETSHPQIVGDGDAQAWAHLEFPLGWHDFGVGAADFHSGVQASAVVSLNDVTTVHFVSASSAIVGTLWAWETTLWPSQWLTVCVQQGVLLLNAEPWLVGGAFVDDLLAASTVVGLRWFAVVRVGLAQNENMWSLTEWVTVDSNRVQVHI